MMWDPRSKPLGGLLGASLELCGHRRALTACGGSREAKIVRKREPLGDSGFEFHSSVPFLSSILMESVILYEICTGFCKLAGTLAPGSYAHTAFCAAKAADGRGRAR